MTVRLGAWAPLAGTLLLATVFGGQIAADVRALEPGFAGLWSGFVDGEAPVFAHALIGLLVLASLTHALVFRRVVQLPAARLTAPFALFLGLLVISVTQSSYRSASVQSLAEWAVYGAAFYGAVALSGRVNGPRFLAGAVMAGCTWLAVKGLLEYGQMRPIDPSWRIFAGWVNANALAGMLLLGLPIALAFAVAERRLAALASGVCATLIALALLLTQSKGGLLFAALGVALFAVLLWVHRPRESQRTAFLRLGACALATVALGAMFVVSQRAPAQGGSVPASRALARVGDVSDTQAQSFTFRKLLWQGALKLAAKRPIGTGIGTYRFHSAEPGLTPQTHLAHQSYLQLAVEAGPVAVLALSVFGVLLLVGALRRGPTSDGSSPILRVALVSALAASAGHNLLDSDLYHFGIGVCFFALAGVAAQLSPDAVTPEFLRPTWRALGTLAAAVAALGLAGSSASELALARVAHALGRGDEAQAREALATAETWAVWEGETWRFATALATDPDERMTLLARAAALSPTPRNFRALAREQAAAGRVEGAEISLARALAIDPNNLSALAQRLELRRQRGDGSGAAEDARRLVEIESEPYFQIRALPEIVPTETFAARTYLASLERDQRKASNLLDPAVKGYLAYAGKTVPLWKSHVEAGVASGGRLIEAREILVQAKEAALRLAGLYRALGKAPEALEAEAAAGVFDAAALDLPST